MLVRLLLSINQFWMKSYKTDVRSVWHIFTHVRVLSFKNLPDWLFPGCKRNGMYVGLNTKQCLYVYLLSINQLWMKSYKIDVRSVWHIFTHICVLSFENLPDWLFPGCKCNGMYVGLNVKQCLHIYSHKSINYEWNVTKLMCVVCNTYLPMYVWYLLKIFQIDFFPDANVMVCM